MSNAKISPKRSGPCENCKSNKNFGGEITEGRRKRCRMGIAGTLYNQVHLLGHFHLLQHFPMFSLQNPKFPMKNLACVKNRNGVPQLVSKNVCAPNLVRKPQFVHKNGTGCHAKKCENCREDRNDCYLILKKESIRVYK